MRDQRYDTLDLEGILVMMLIPTVTPKTLAETDTAVTGSSPMHSSLQLLEESLRRTSLNPFSHF